MSQEITTPPKLPLKFFRWYCHPKLVDHIEGDLLEVYSQRVRESGKRKADIRFIIDILLLFRRRIIRPVEGYKNLNTYSMYKSYFKIGWRSLIKNKGYSLINISGLALGITCALLIFSLVTYYFSFDNYHPHSDRIYRFVTDQQREQLDHSGSVPPAFGNAFREDYTYGEKVARLYSRHEPLISFHQGPDLKKFKEEVVSFAEPGFFEIFHFPLVAGNSKMIAEPHTAFITERMAQKYFGDASPLDKVLRFENLIDFRIVGVLGDIPDNTYFRSEIYLSFVSLREYNPWAAADDSWGGITSELQTFARLQPGIDPVEVEAALPEYSKKYRPNSRNVHHYKLQPLRNMHFDSRYGGIMDKTTLMVLSSIGFFLILTACLNFVNLATAQALTRAKEVGVRKTLGGARSQLFWQFSLETFMIVLVSGVLGLAIAHTVLPFLNELFNARARFDLSSNLQLWVFLPLLLIVVTFFSCLYPGIILSGFKPALALKGKLVSQGPANFKLRRMLITAQFSIAQVLLIGLIVIFYQMNYFKSTDMGFSQDAVIMIPVGSRDAKMNNVKERFAMLPNVSSVSACFAAPSSNSSWNTSLRFDNKTENEIFSVSLRGADENYLGTFDIPLVAGRNLTRSDSIREFLVNETFTRKLNLHPEDILGKPIRVNGDWTGPVVGVVKDFHDQSLHSEINPVFLTTSSENYYYYAVKINMADSHTTLKALEKIWSETYPELMYEYEFLDEQIAAFYEREETMLILVRVFSFIALFIGGLGLYGLVTFMAIQKTKEIGIRKVLGGNVSQILWIFWKEFSRLVIIAFLLAAPIAWWLMSNWLENYEYRIDITPWIFVMEILIVFLVVLLTVGYQSFKAAMANPVSSLRSE